MLPKAITLATKLHEGQFRKGGDPYITHPIAVSHILKQHGFSEEVQTLGILHDLCEDTALNNRDIEKEFTPDIAFSLYALSKNNKSQNKDKSSIDFRMSMYMRRFGSCAAQMPMILYVKMADQIHNLSTMEEFTQIKKQRKREEVTKFFMPIYEQKELIPESDLIKYEGLLIELQEALNLEL